MCDSATLVPIPALLWQNDGIYEFNPDHPEYGVDDEGRRCLAIDTCIVPAVRALWDAGVVTLSCCCGHGNGWGVITVKLPATPGRLGTMLVRADEWDLIRTQLNEASAEAERLRGELEEGRKRAQYLLESLTPGGTEFHRNPERCAQWVADRLSNAHRITVEAVKARNAAEAERDAWQARAVEVDRLLDYVRPILAEAYGERRAVHGLSFTTAVGDACDLIDTRERFAVSRPD